MTGDACIARDFYSFDVSVLYFWQMDLSYTFSSTDPPGIDILLDIEKKVIECNPNGIPHNYTYHQWKHLSEYGQLIRLLPDRSILELESPGVHIENYLLNGIYVCTAENGISDAFGSTVKSGEKLVLIKGSLMLTTNLIFRIVSNSMLKIEEMWYQCH